MTAGERRAAPKPKPSAATPKAPSTRSRATKKPSVAVAAVPAPAVPITERPAVAERAPDRRRPLLLLAAAVLLLAIIGFAGGRMLSGDHDPFAGVVVGEPRGEVFGSTPNPTTAPTRRPTAQPTASPTAAPTLAPTPAPIAAATPAPVEPPPAVPAPTPVMVAMAITPDRTVASWYSLVEDGEFDAAYALWSDRMRASFPREGNLDNRWRDTADITFTELYVAEQTQTTAKVQVEFVETKEDGSSRRFIGWWDLVRSGDGWLLDQPHF